MIIWIVLTAMTSAAAVLMAAPFLRRLDDRRSDHAGATAVYGDQLGEIESEARAGLIDLEQAGYARAEIERRMLSTDRVAATSVQSGSPPLSTGQRNFALIAITCVVVIGSVGLYAVQGRPELAAGGSSAGSDAVAQLAALSQAESESQLDRGDQTGHLGTVDEMVDRLARRLQLQPDDPEGWRMLGWSYYSTQRYQQAVDAYAKAVGLNPAMPLLQSSYGEAMVKAADGRVTPSARAIFDAALKLDHKDPRARYFKGLAKEQDGLKAEALEDWLAVLTDAVPNEAWAPDLETQVAKLAGELGIDVSTRLAQTRKSGGGGILALLNDENKSHAPQPADAVPHLQDKGPTPEDIRNAESMAPADRTAMIHGMVDSLAARLQQSPRDADGWIKLVRSHVVLGETAAARTALRQALKAFDDAPQEQSRIAAAAKELGVAQ